MTSALALAVATALALAVIAYSQFRKAAAYAARLAPILDADQMAKGLRAKAESQAKAKALESEQLLVKARSQADDIRAEAAAAAEQLLAQARSELLTLHNDIAGARLGFESEQTTRQDERRKLMAEYSSARTVFDQLISEVRVLEENLEDVSYGIYKPHFTYQTSDAYKEALERLYHREKELIKSGRAGTCGLQWQVGGSVKEGQKMTKQYVKLLIRAFNAESDTCIARVAWNNVRIMEERIRKAFSALNQLGGVMQMSLSTDLLEIKLSELILTHEQEEKKQQEKEEARRVREQIREEEKVQRELARAAEEAEAEEKAAEKELARVRKDAARAADEAQRELLTQRIQELESQLVAAHSQRERAIAQAQLTRCGHVYVLSNLGAFGEGIVKIGMTRRLEPKERVAELGDASVPFPFDLHTLIYTEDAPQLETDLHTHFWDRRINYANDRKEFFRISPREIEEYLTTRGLKASMTHLCEAKEFRQSCTARESWEKQVSATPKTAPALSTYPQELFSSTATAPGSPV